MKMKKKGNNSNAKKFKTSTSSPSVKCELEEPLEDEDEQLIDSSSILPSCTVPEIDEDPLSFTSGQEVNLNCGEPVASSSPPPIRELRRRKAGIVYCEEDESGVKKRIKSSPHTKTLPSCSSSPKNMIKIIVPSVPNECVEKEVKVKIENDCSDHDDQIGDKLVQNSSSATTKPPGSTKNEDKKSKEATKRKRNTDPAIRRLARARDNERRRQRRAAETPAQKEERRKKNRERRRKCIENFPQIKELEAERQRRRREHEKQKFETEAEKEKRLSRRRQKRANETESEKKERLRRLAASKYFAWEAKKASLPPEEAEQAEFQLKMNKYMYHVAYKARFTKEEWKEKLKQNRLKKKRFAELPVEKKKIIMEKRKKYMERIPAETKKKYSQTAMRNYINKLKTTNPAKLEQVYGKMKKACRDKVARETPEERQKRLLRYKVYQAKRKAKIRMEEEGILTPEVIERRLEEVVRQVEEKDRLEREKNPVDPAEYKPRESARKPRKKNTTNKSSVELSQLEPCPSTSGSQPECPSSSISTSQVEEHQEVGLQEVVDPPVFLHSESTPQSQSHCVKDEPCNDDDGWVPVITEIMSNDNGEEIASNTSVEYKPRQKTRKPKTKNKTDKSKEKLKIIEPCPSSSSQEQDPSQQECPSFYASTEVELSLEIDSQPSPMSPHSEATREGESFCVDNDGIKTEKENCEEDIASDASPTPPPSPPSPLACSDDEQEQPPLPPPPKSFEEKSLGVEVEVRPEADPLEKTRVLVEERVICDECGKCLYPGSMKVHKHLFHNPLKVSCFKCPKCGKEFATAHRLWNHYLNLHDEEKKVLSKEPSAADHRGPFICEQCGKKYTTKAICEAHVKKVHLGERIICEVCGKEEQTQSKMWRHKTAWHPELDTPPPEGMVICMYCSEPVFRSLPHHVKKFHPDKYEEFVDGVKGDLIVPSGKKRRKRIKCDKCDKELRLDDLKRHMRNVHGQGSKAIPCQYCGRAFKEKFQLTEHIRRLHTIHSFDRKVDAMKLIKETKDEEGQTQLICSLCDEKLFRRNDIGGHLLSNHLDVFEQLSKKDDEVAPLWKCVECSEEGSPFKNEQLFFSHVKSRHPEKTKYCSQLNCHKLFATQHSLRVHHKEEHPHAKFRNPLCFEGGNYRRPRLRCDCCMMIFLRKPALMEHVRTLHPEAYWPCPHCELMFYTEEKLMDTHESTCRRNPKVRKPKKGVVKGKRERRKKLPQKPCEGEEAESEPDDDWCSQEKVRVVTKTSLGTRKTRSSSRIKVKTKKNTKRGNCKLQNESSDDPKLRKEVKVVVTRLTNAEIDAYAFERKIDLTDGMIF